jgi:hypothetical protein
MDVMNEHNDYLWDRSGPEDPEIKRLESLLGQFKQGEVSSPLPADYADKPIVLWLALPLAAAATFLIAFMGNREVPVAPQTSWTVERLSGAPMVNSAPLGDAGAIAAGAWIHTDDTSTAVVQIGKIGKVQIEPNSRVQLVSTDPNNNRLSLTSGTLQATVWAPPRLFFVETPSATAIDLGCAYTLSVDGEGRARLCVTSGWVALEKSGHEEVVVPSGAVCETRPEHGPGTPYFGGASDEFRAALGRFDFEGASSEDLETVLRESNMCELFTLWQLLPSVRDEHRGMIFDRMSQIMPPPAGVTREGVLALDSRMLEAWGVEFSREEFMPCLTSCTAALTEETADLPI